MTAAEFTDRFDYDPDNDLLGEGGFGKIFKAWDNVRNEFIALKMSKVQPGMEEFSLLSEYERVKLLEHPNIARYMDCRRIKLPGIGTHDIALMKYYEHGNLSQLLAKHTLSEMQRQKIIDGLLDGIQYLHKHKPLIIHSDLKPSNILIVERRGFYIPLITDFGISRQASVDDKSYVTNLTGAGTYAYAAPEQWEAKELRPNADLWSFGILAIYVWFNGKKLPFRADDISIATESGRIEYMKRVLALDFIPDLKGLPENYRRMIDACLIVNPTLRVKSVDELLGKVRNPTHEGNGEETQVLKKIAPRRSTQVQMDEKTRVLEQNVVVPAPPIEIPRVPLYQDEIILKPSSKKNTIVAVLAASVAALGGLAFYIMQVRSEPQVAIQPVVKMDSIPKMKQKTEAIAAPKISEAAILPIDKKTKKDVENFKKEPVLGSVYLVVEESPTFPGGTAIMNNWLENNLQMPDEASSALVSGSVRLSFVVNVDGTREDIHVLKGLGHGCDQEAVRLVKAMPRWIAGRTAGNDVRVRHTININFE